MGKSQKTFAETTRFHFHTIFYEKPNFRKTFFG